MIQIYRVMALIRQEYNKIIKIVHFIRRQSKESTSSLQAVFSTHSIVSG